MDTLDDRYVHLYKEIGLRVRQARIAANMTQSGLAAAIRLNRTSITNIERGRQKLLVHTLIEIGRALRVPTEALLVTTSNDIKDIANLSIPKTLSEKDRAIIESIILPTSEERS